MQESPYSGIINLVRRQAGTQIPVSFRFGTVKSISPLTVSVDETDQSGNDLLKNAAIGDLQIGDSVMLVSLNGDQQFLVLCKVVSV